MKLLLAVLSFSFLFSVLAEPITNVPYHKMTPEKKKEFLRHHHEMRYRRTGGKVFDRRGQMGRVVFLNAQKIVDEKTFSSIPLKLGELLLRSVVMKTSDKPMTSDELFSVTENLDAEAIIIITEDKKLPSLFIAPEAGYSVVNVAAFKTDDQAKMVLRTRREMIRAFLFLCAAGSMVNGSVLEAVKTPEDIDELVGEGFGQDVMMLLDKHLTDIGIKPYVVTSYRKACEQGWAPAPTNDVQRAIWDEVHAIPKDPLKIEFDPKIGR